MVSLPRFQRVPVESKVILCELSRLLLLLLYDSEPTVVETERKIAKTGLFLATLDNNIILNHIAAVVVTGSARRE